MAKCLACGCDADPPPLSSFAYIAGLLSAKEVGAQKAIDEMCPAHRELLTGRTPAIIKAFWDKMQEESREVAADGK